MLDFMTLTTDNIKNTLLQVLENSNYTMNAKKASRRFKDQKEKPLDRAIWWIEWVLRNPESDFMKSPVLKLGYFVGHSLDVIGFVVMSLIFILYILCRIVRFCSSKSNNCSNSSENYSKKWN